MKKVFNNKDLLKEMMKSKRGEIIILDESNSIEGCGMSYYTGMNKLFEKIKKIKIQRRKILR